MFVQETIQKFKVTHWLRDSLEEDKNIVKHTHWSTKLTSLSFPVVLQLQFFWVCVFGETWQPNKLLKEFTDQTCSLRLKQLMDISHIVPLFFFSTTHDYILQWIRWMLPRNSSLLLSVPISCIYLFLFPRCLSHQSPLTLTPFGCGWLHYFLSEFIHSKQPILEKKPSWFYFNPTWKEPVSCHHLIQSEEGKIMFLAESSNISNIKTTLFYLKKKSHLLWGRY